MQPHPDFADRVPPRSADLGAFRLAPLAPYAADEDFAAVTGSVAVLRGLFGGTWPEGLTLAENRIDLAWHEREFTLGRSFSWILRDRQGTYLGCAYLFPDPGARRSGHIYLWLVDKADRLVLLERCQPVLAAWLTPWLPENSNFQWHTNNGATT